MFSSNITQNTLHVRAKSLARTWYENMHTVTPTKRKNPNTMYSGLYAQRASGTGSQFWQYRSVESGDDASKIDWRKSARTDEYYVREHEIDKPSDHLIWCDSKATMYIPTDKSDMAYVISLAIMSFYLDAGQQVTLLHAGKAVKTFDHAVTMFLSAIGVHKESSIDNTTLLSRYITPGTTNITLVSDFLNENTRQIVDLLTKRNITAALVQTLTHQEQNFLFTGHVKLKDQIHTDFVSPSIEEVRTSYLEKLREIQDYLSYTTRTHNWPYVIHTIEDDPNISNDLYSVVCL